MKFNKLPDYHKIFTEIRFTITIAIDDDYLKQQSFYIKIKEVIW